MYWETNRTTATLTYLPAIVTFLGYCPYDEVIHRDNLAVIRRDHEAA